MAAPRSLLLLLLAGALLGRARADVERRCTEVVEGTLLGEPLALEPILVPPGERHHNLTIPVAETCGAGGARGLVVTACDVLPPQVDVSARGDVEWGDVHVLRLGPLWLPLLLELTLFCESGPLPPVTVTPATDHATTPAPSTSTPAPSTQPASPEPPGPVVVPEH